MNWENYEDTVKDIYERLGRAQGIKIICHGRECKVTGKSGVEHQVDVLTEHSIGLHTYRTAIECKYWNQRRPKDDVTKLAEILEDAQIEKGVIVSKLGFTEDAIIFAKYKNVSLVELRKPESEDWDGRVKDISLRLVSRLPVATEFGFEVSEQANLPEGSLNTSAFVIREPSGQEITLKMLIDQMIAAVSTEDDDTSLARREFAAGTLMASVDGAFMAKISAFQFMLRFERNERVTVLQGEERVAMILIALFEKQRLVISPDGDVRQSDF